MKVCQELAHHSTPALTIGIYAHTRLHDLTVAIEAVQAFDVADERCTSTADARRRHR